MSESVEEMDYRGVVTRTPDHSLMSWEIASDWVSDEMEEGKDEDELEGGMVKRYVVPEGYLEGEVERVRLLMNKVETAGKDKKVIDEIYRE